MKLIDKVALILIRERRVLFVRSNDSDTFYTVGGKREPGETDIQTLEREVKEETGTDVIPESVVFFEMFVDPVHNQPDKTLRLTCYIADVSGTPKPSSEIAEMAWLNTATTHKLTPTGRSVLQLLKEKNLID